VIFVDPSEISAFIAAKCECWLHGFVAKTQKPLSVSSTSLTFPKPAFTTVSVNPSFD
jgi:hypothetical protein